jgi:hypothetical protein
LGEKYSWLIVVDGGGVDRERRAAIYEVCI